MSKQITEKSRYISKYAVDTWVSAAQYIAELICESIAKTKGEMLVVQFWNKSKFWRNTFVRQCALAGKLLKNYEPYVIIESIQKCPRLTSLASPILKQLLVKNQQKFQQNLQETLVSTNEINEAPREPLKTRKSILELDE